MNVCSRDPLIQTVGPVLVVGTGLIGASIGLGLTAHGVSVRLRDASPAAAALARDVGAGELEDTADGTAPALVVVAAPPDVAAGLVAAALRSYPDAVVTDVASVKSTILGELRAFGTDLSRYVGSHPMAGRERSGASAGDGDLFAGRPWVLTPHPDSDHAATRAVHLLAQDLGASPVQMSPVEHDRAVALVSHLPQLLSSLTAARLIDAPDGSLALAGQGLRDVTRIAASDPRLWSTIVVGNAEPVRQVMLGVRDDLDRVLGALDRAVEDGPLAHGAMAGIAAVVATGNDGAARIPGKHGGTRRRYRGVTVLVPDQPGELGRLFSEIGEAAVNIEDLALEHSAKQKVGLATISVLPEAADRLVQELEGRGWRVVKE